MERDRVSAPSNGNGGEDIEQGFVGSEPRHGLTLSFSSANDVLEALEKPVHDLSFRSDERVLLRHQLTVHSHGHAGFSLSPRVPSERLHLFLYNDYLMLCREAATPPQSSGCFPFLSKPRSPPKRRPRSLRVALIACLFHSYVSAQADVSGLRGAGVVDVKLRKRTLSLFFDSAGEAEEWEKHLSATIRNAQSLPAGLYERSFRSHEEKDKKRVLVIVAILIIPMSLLAQGVFLLTPAKVAQNHIFKECFVPENMRQQILWLTEHTVQLLEKQNVTWWVDDGLMLGIGREGGQIPWDGDVDIAIMQHDAWKLTVGLEKVADRLWFDWEVHHWRWIVKRQFRGISEEVRSQISKSRQTQLRVYQIGPDDVYEWMVVHIDQDHTKAHGSGWRPHVKESGQFDDPPRWERRIELYEFHPLHDDYVDNMTLTSQTSRVQADWIGSRPFKTVDPGGFGVRVPEQLWKAIDNRYGNARKLELPKKCQSLPTTNIPGLTKAPVHHYPENYTLLYLALMEITTKHIAISFLPMLAALCVAYMATSCAFRIAEGNANARLLECPSMAPVLTQRFESDDS